MKKTYLLAYSDVLGTRAQLKTALDHIALVDDWRYDIPHTFYLLSQASAREIAEALQRALGSGRFIVSEIGDNYWGKGSTDTWRFISGKPAPVASGEV